MTVGYLNTMHNHNNNNHHHHHRSINPLLVCVNNLSKSSAMLLFFTLLLVSNSLMFVRANEIKGETAAEQDFEELGLHYGKYLKEVVAALDKDQKFTETIKNMDAEDIKSGKVAEQLKHVHEDVRKKLNDLKYLEIKRLASLGTRKHEMEQFGETYHGNDKRKWRTLGLKDVPEHLANDAHHFDVSDLHKLMVAATNDLEKLDKERKEDFKTYEMEKEWQFQERLKMMNETEKETAKKLRQELKDKHDNHPKVHEPGKMQQFEEVWEKKEHLPVSEFDPKVFFAMYDKNSDGFWDPSEVKPLLKIEVSKLYDPNNPEDDPNEMEEDYERMREHIYKEIDADKDGLISLKEFVDYSKRPEARQDNGWDDVGKEKAYTDKDYEDYMRNREAMLRQSHGYYDPSHYANQPSNLHLPHWAYGMPGGANPAQYYGYQVDPNHPQAAQIMAHQQMAHQQMAQQNMAFQQHQQAGYQQPNYQQPQAAYQQPQVAHQQQANIYHPANTAQQPGQVPQIQQIPQQPQVQQQYQQQAQAQIQAQVQPPVQQGQVPNQQQQAQVPVQQQQAQVPVQQQQQPMQMQAPIPHQQQQQQPPVQQPQQQQFQQQQQPPKYN